MKNFLTVVNAINRQLDKGRRGDNAWPLFGLVMRLIQAVSTAIRERQVQAKAKHIRRWVCIGMAAAGTCHRMWLRKDARYSGNAIPPTSSRHIVSQGRMYARRTYICPNSALILDRSTINPEHCDTEFPSEPPRPNNEKSYSILRFELSQISSE